jgi:hypothetical protein
MPPRVFELVAALRLARCFAARSSGWTAAFHLVRSLLNRGREVPNVSAGNVSMNSSKPTTGRKKGATPSAIPAKAIASRAFELFAARGGAHGYDVDDWLRAEHELIAAAARPPRRAARKPVVD